MSAPHVSPPSASPSEHPSTSQLSAEEAAIYDRQLRVRTHTHDMHSCRHMQRTHACECTGAHATGHTHAHMGMHMMHMDIQLHMHIRRASPCACDCACANPCVYTCVYVCVLGVGCRCTETHAFCCSMYRGNEWLGCRSCQKHRVGWNWYV